MLNKLTAIVTRGSTIAEELYLSRII